jgi:hypothetical protein
MRILHLTLLSVIFIFRLFTASAQNTISGTVRNNKGETIPNVTVFLSGTKAITAADNNGKFNLWNVASGSYTLTARSVGFQNLNFTVSV